MACYGGLWGILSGLTKSTDLPSTRPFIIGSKRGPLIWALTLFFLALAGFEVFAFDWYMEWKGYIRFSD